MMNGNLLNTGETINKLEIVLVHEVAVPPDEYDPAGQGVQEPETLS